VSGEVFTDWPVLNKTVVEGGTGSGVSTMATDRSMVGGVATSVAVLSAGQVSASAARTLAVLVSVTPPEGTVTVMVTWAAVAAAMVPSEQVTVDPAAAQLPWVAVAEVNVVPAGRGSVRTTPVAGVPEKVRTSRV